MIDLHNHILPGVDDGAADLAESLEIARQFVSEGVTQAAATPHYNPEGGTGPDRIDLCRKVEALQAALVHEAIPLTILPGHELYLTPDSPSLLGSGLVAPLGTSNAVLVEVSFDQRPLYLQDTFFHLQLAGYRPVLAHPERYAFVQRDTACVDELVEKGVILQLTAPSLLGEYGPRVRHTAEQLLRRGAFALAASDRHHPGPLRSLSELHDRLAQVADIGLADLLLQENPARLLAGRELIRAEPPKTGQPSLLARLFRSRS
jgi:protein-tyrosine phosphatase